MVRTPTTQTWAPTTIAPAADLQVTVTGLEGGLEAGVARTITVEVENLTGRACGAVTGLTLDVTGPGGASFLDVGPVDLGGSGRQSWTFDYTPPLVDDTVVFDYTVDYAHSALVDGPVSGQFSGVVAITPPRPIVTRSSGQPDTTGPTPAGDTTVQFDVTFDALVNSDLTAADLQIIGTTGADTVALVLLDQDSAGNFNATFEVSGMTREGVVGIRVPAGVATVSAPRRPTRRRTASRRCSTTSPAPRCTSTGWAPTPPDDASRAVRRRRRRRRHHQLARARRHRRDRIGRPVEHLDRPHVNDPDFQSYLVTIGAVEDGGTIIVDVPAGVTVDQFGNRSTTFTKDRSVARRTSTCNVVNFLTFPVPPAPSTPSPPTRAWRCRGRLRPTPATCRSPSTTSRC